jgi:hypothetical protein
LKSKTNKKHLPGSPSERRDTGCRRATLTGSGIHAMGLAPSTTKHRLREAPGTLPHRVACNPFPAPRCATPWIAEIDFSTIEKVNGSDVTDDLRSRQGDVIWRAG